MEEALLTLNGCQPLYLAGGFGGVTGDIARALGIDDRKWVPSIRETAPEDPRFTEGYRRLVAVATDPYWGGLNNGLSDEENQRLAVSHRPSDIASLVSLGLGRLARESGSTA
jgi:hypothetical protein